MEYAFERGGDVVLSLLPAEEDILTLSGGGRLNQWVRAQAGNECDWRDIGDELWWDVPLPGQVWYPIRTNKYLEKCAKLGAIKVLETGSRFGGV